MPELSFKGKPYVWNHHLEVECPRLVARPDKSLTDKVSLDDNLVIHGDNLLALKAIESHFAGKVDVVYIDPPYNTGREKWVYNDNVNSSDLHEWLGKVVGTGDLNRHDKWLCMMTPRLRMLYELLSEDGVMFVSIDENECHHLRLLMDEIFGEENFVCEFVWLQNTAINFGGVKVMTEYILCYKKSRNNMVNFETRLDEPKFITSRITKVEHRRFRITFPKGLRIIGVIDKEFSGTVGGNSEPIKIVSDKMVFKNGVLAEDTILEAEWSSPSIIEKLLRGEKAYDRKGQEYVEIFFNPSGVPQYKKINNTETITNVISRVGDSKRGTAEIRRLFGKDVFNSPKPVGLIKHLLKILPPKDRVVLDSFAGSGTTAQAVLELNKENMSNHKFILIECEDYADGITAERIRRIIRGLPGKEGLNASFSYYELD
jgi:adenine-specific DNA-methyltransferase